MGEDSEARVCRVLLGLIPRLVIGCVFVDGRQIGFLGTFEKTFSFKRGEYNRIIKRISDDLYQLDPPTRIHAEKVLAAKSYPLRRDFEDSYAVTLVDSDSLLLIPCSEIFRTFYAPTRDFALTFGHGPWEQSSARLGSPDQVYTASDRNWRIKLRRKVAAAQIPLLANLLCHPYGRKAANGIYASLFNGQPSARIWAGVPFPADDFNITARCVALPRTHHERWLVTQIIRFLWPYQGVRIEHYPERVVGHGSDGAENRQRDQVVRKRFLDVDRDANLEVTSDDDPGSVGGAPNMYAPSAIVRNPPEVSKVESTSESTGSGRSIRSDLVAVGSFSSGPEGGSASVGPINYQATSLDVEGHLFSRLAALFDDLQDSGALKSWRVVQPTASGYLRGNFSVWPFPTIYTATNRVFTWPLIDADRPYLKRTALICQVYLENKSFYFLEIEPRHSEEHFRSLLFWCGVEKISHVVTELLTIAATHRGIWPKQLPGISENFHWKTWKHQYLRDKGNDESGQMRPFNAASALDAMQRIAAEISPG